jgi:hypothetical protein
VPISDKIENRFKINTLMMHLTVLEKNNTNPKSEGKQQIFKAEINEIKTKRNTKNQNLNKILSHTC